MDDEIQEQAVTAAEFFCGRALAYLAPGKTTLRGAWLGSAIPMVTPGGLPLLLTAKHNLLDDDEKNLEFDHLVLGHRDQKSPVQVAIRDVELHPSGQVDVAIALPAAAAEPLVREHAIPTGVVHAGPLPEPPFEVRASGWPFALTTADGDGPSSATVHARPLVYGTFIDGFDEKGRLLIRWAQRTGIRQTGEERRDNGEPVPMMRPNGVSGGGVWLFDTGATGVWNVDAGARLIAVMSAWDKRGTEYGVPAAMWFDWFMETVGRMDSRKGG